MVLLSYTFFGEMCQCAAARGNSLITRAVWVRESLLLLKQELDSYFQVSE